MKRIRKQRLRRPPERTYEEGPLPVLETYSEQGEKSQEEVEKTNELIQHIDVLLNEIEKPSPA